jgi:hypothetical protein
MASPVDVRLLHTETHWAIEDAVVLVGRHDKAAIRLDHEEVARRHAVFFRFGRDPAVFDLGGKEGIYVNGQCCTITPLAHGDCVTVSKFGLVVGLPDDEEEFCSGSTNGTSKLKSAFSPVLLKGHGGQEDAAEGNGREESAKGGLLEPVEDGVVVREALEAMDGNIANAWDRLNSWQSQLERDASALSQQECDLATRAEELDAKDAAIRGQLYDISQFNEELKMRERELARQTAELQEQRDALNARENAIEQGEQDLEKRIAEVQRREGALAQRWSRLRSTKCANCGCPVNVGPISNGGKPGKASTDG